ncbi:LysR family transcriptional regulator [Streptosporangium canum]|uniref:helix-turn-helix domain-containing protein n=1 Tax=Streptosporangium canum TaxID=324952 RepID=UPI0033B3742B
MERQDIEVFLALAEELHFARTAELLHVSAATISQTVAKLERRSGAPHPRRRRHLIGGLLPNVTPAPK